MSNTLPRAVAVGDRAPSAARPRHVPTAANPRRALKRLLPLAAVAIAAFAYGVSCGTAPGRAERRTAERYVAAWARGDFGAMYRMLSKGARERVSPGAFTAAYREAALTATLGSLRAHDANDTEDGAVPVPVEVTTRAFGAFRAVEHVPLDGSGEDAHVGWRPEMVFPGLRAGERLTRRTTLAARGDLEARDGTALAAGPDRRSAAPDVSAEIAGGLGPIPADRREFYRAFGYPPDAQIGISGLERTFQPQLAGAPGGTLLAGARTLARSAPRPGRTVRTSISVRVERAAIAALGGRYGGVAALQPRSGQVLALAGVAFSALQPPGSTFKVITTSAALQAGIVKPSTAFPVQTHAVLEGVDLSNAGGEACGGTLAEAFAESCNSVFAPLGARLGAPKLVAAAERFGFNEPTGIPGAETPSIPQAGRVGDDLAVGSTAIGQGDVQATALSMASVAATIANGGVRVRPVLQAGRSGRATRAATPRVARTMNALMRGVVTGGTGTAAQIPGIAVAGKTGTAELRDTTQPGAGGPEDTDAWFVAFAPAGDPRIAVGVLLVSAGAGGDTAAPVAHDVLVGGLK